MKKKNGFTLLELLAVIVILSIIGGTCTVDGVESKFCKVITVKELIDSDYYKSNEVNTSNKKDLINNVTNKSMLCDEIQIYKKNNRVYAKALNIKSNDVNYVCDKSY